MSKYNVGLNPDFMATIHSRGLLVHVILTLGTIKTFAKRYKNRLNVTTLMLCVRLDLVVNSVMDDYN